MNRYTINQLESDTEKLNVKLGNARHKFRLTIERKHGFTQIYLATSRQRRKSCTERMVGAGSPRECHLAALEYVAEVSQ